MRQCAYLSMDYPGEFEVYDHLTYPSMAKLGWQVTEVAWTDTNVDWNDFEVIVIRSPWDYQDHPQQFLEVLQRIDASDAVLLNSLATVQWNISKSYLKTFASKGVPIVPTLWFMTFDLAAMQQAYIDWDTPELIIKPQISANADDTFRLPPAELADSSDQLASLFTDREHMVQPFLPAIVEEGEYSLFYFAAEYSHAIIKKPAHGDFRVQEEHGGELLEIEPEAELRAAGDKVIAALSEPLLYARVDVVRHQGEFVLMELEAIEPSLYFNMSASAAGNFAQAFNTMINEMGK